MHLWVHIVVPEAGERQVGKQARLKNDPQLHIQLCACMAELTARTVGCAGGQGATLGTACLQDAGCPVGGTIIYLYFLGQAP